MQIVAQWGGIGALAVATGPSLGAAIVSAGGWRWAFFVNIPVGLFVLVAGRRVLTESPRDDTAGTPDYLGVVLMSLSLAALVLAVSEGSTWGWTDARILSALAVALVGGAVFVHRTRHHDNPVIDPALFQSRSVRARQQRHRRVRRRLLRHAAREHPVPHRGVGLLDHDRPASP